MYTYTVLRGHDKNFTIPSLYNKFPLPRYFFQQIFHSIFLARKEKKKGKEKNEDEIKIGKKGRQFLHYPPACNGNSRVRFPRSPGNTVIEFLL